MSGNADSSTLQAPRATGASLVLVWVLEIALARITSDVVPLAEVAASAVLLVLLPLVCMAAVGRLPASERARLTLAGIIGSLPLLAVAAGIVLPVALRFSGAVLAGLLGLVLLSVLFAGVQRARSAGNPAPSPGVVFGVLSASAAAAWVLLPAGFPPYQIAVPFLVVGLGTARLAQSESRIPALTAIGVALALWPPVLPPFPWASHATRPDGPDIVLVTVDSLTSEGAAALPSFRRIVDTGVQWTSVDGPQAPARPQLAELLGGVPLGAAHDTHAAPSLRAEVATLAERLREHGYDTAAAVGPDAYAAIELGMHRGFVVYHHFAARNAHALPRWRENLQPAAIRERNFVASPVAADLMVWLGLRSPRVFGAAADVVAVAGRIMAERREGPIFLWIHLIDPSAPYAHAFELDVPRRERQRLATGERHQLGALAAEVRAAYGNELSHVDAALTPFLEAVRKEAKRPTVVALASTRGDTLVGAAGDSLPMALSGATAASGPHSASDEVQLIDLTTTLLATAGINAPDLPGRVIATLRGSVEPGPDGAPVR